MSNRISLARFPRHLLTAALAVTGWAGCTSPSPAWPGAPLAAHEVVQLDAAHGSQSEGIAVHGTTAYLGYAASGQVVRVDLTTRAVAPFATLPQPAAGKGFVTGLALRGDQLYGGLASFVPEVVAGIYRSEGGGRPATLFARHPDMAFPNGLAFDDRGQLYVTDSAASSVFRVAPDGTVVQWAVSPLLAGAKDGCGTGGVGVPFDIGGNGLAVEHDAIYVTNTDRGSLVRIPLRPDGSAGTPALVAGPSCELNGADGLAIGPDGAFIVAINHQNKLVRIDRAGHATTILAGGPLDFPSSLAFEGGTLYISNFAFLDGKDAGIVSIQ